MHQLTERRSLMNANSYSEEELERFSTITTVSVAINCCDADGEIYEMEDEVVSNPNGLLALIDIIELRYSAVGADFASKAQNAWVWYPDLNSFDVYVYDPTV